MKISLKDLVGEDDYSFPSYQRLVESYGYEVLDSISLGSYQGDIVMVVGNMAGQYGLLVTGYGSCSGCDALEGCGNRVDELEELRERLCASVIFHSPAEMIETLEHRDWGGQYYSSEYDEPEFKEWLSKVKEALIMRQLAGL